MSDNSPCPEFSRAIALSDIGAGAVEREIVASDEERAALAKRFGLIDLGLLSATTSLYRDGDVFLATGRLNAVVTQSCVATGDPVPTQIDEALTVRFTADPDHAPDAEIELGSDECDTMFHDGRVIDLGEAVAQSLALALDPFPRSAHAEAILKAAGVQTEEEAESQASPFAALAALKDTLGKD